MRNRYNKPVSFCVVVYASFSLFLSQFQQEPELTGIWKGSSLCQVTSSPCHDEEVVYHISKGNTPDSFVLLMNKIVNGKEEEMGSLAGRYQADTKQLVCEQRKNAIWTFKWSKDHLQGNLIYNNQLYRVIDVTRLKP
jgi:hypothetical protein